MVLCKYFQQGGCRFGNKCYNEHFDVKQLVKTDIEGAINGKQWPLSCYGPFKDKGCIPNFIDDQSFEEVRSMCYEAKQNNFFDQFHQEFTKAALEANNKMRMLLQLTPEVVDVVSKIYDGNAEANNSQSGTNTGSNPFGLNANANQASSIFAKSNTTNPPAGNIFGGNTSFQGQSFQGNNLFGSPAAANQPQQQPQQNIFGTAANNQVQNNIFGGAVAPASNIFGGGLNQQQQPQTSIFGQANQATPNSVFGTNAATQGGNIFSQQQNTVPASPFGQQTPATPTTGFFAQALQATPAPAQNLFNSFATPTQQTPAPFGTPVANNSGNLFATQTTNNTGIFPQQVAQQQQPAQQTANGLFAQAVAQQNSSQTSSLFTNPQPNQNSFTQPAVNESASMPQQQTGFGQTPPTNVFGTPVQNTTQQQGQNQNQQSQFPQQRQTQQQQVQSKQTSSLYSKIDDLDAHELEKFKSDFFSLDSLPLTIPPRELC